MRDKNEQNLKDSSHASHWNQIKTNFKSIVTSTETTEIATIHARDGRVYRAETNRFKEIQLTIDANRMKRLSDQPDIELDE